MRLLGVDFGFKRIGLAITDAEVGLPSPLASMEASGSLKRDAERIAQMGRRESADQVVVGLPLELEGEEGRMARICRSLAELIQAHGFVVHLVDESMTSVQAENGMLARGLKASQRRKHRDGEAAAFILERFLHEARQD